jgi:hypothetical protein
MIMTSAELNGSSSTELTGVWRSFAVGVQMKMPEV